MMKAKTERREIRKLLKEGKIKLSAMVDAINDKKNHSRKERRMLATALGLTPKVEITLAPPGFYWKHGPKVSQHRLKRDRKEFVENAPSEIANTAPSV